MREDGVGRRLKSTNAPSGLDGFQDCLREGRSKERRKTESPPKEKKQAIPLRIAKAILRKQSWGQSWTWGGNVNVFGGKQAHTPPTREHPLPPEAEHQLVHTQERSSRGACCARTARCPKAGCRSTLEVSPGTSKKQRLKQEVNTSTAPVGWERWAFTVTERLRALSRSTVIKAPRSISGTERSSMPQARVEWRKEVRNGTQSAKCAADA